MKKLLTCKGFSMDGKIIVPPNKAHAKYVESNLKSYFTFPPLYLPKETRWNEAWNMRDYYTDYPIASESNLNRFPKIKEDAKGYTWICYVEM